MNNDKSLVEWVFKIEIREFVIYQHLIFHQSRSESNTYLNIFYQHMFNHIPCCQCMRLKSSLHKGFSTNHKIRIF